MCVLAPTNSDQKPEHPDLIHLTKDAELDSDQPQFAMIYGDKEKWAYTGSVLTRIIFNEKLLELLEMDASSVAVDSLKLGIQEFYNFMDNAKYFQYIREGFEFFVGQAIQPEMNLSKGRVAFVELRTATGKVNYFIKYSLMSDLYVLYRKLNAEKTSQ